MAEHPYRALESLVPNHDVWLAMPTEERGPLLLVYLLGVGSDVHQNGKISHHNFINSIPRLAFYSSAQHGAQIKIEQSLKEAWAWLVANGYLVLQDMSGGGWYFVPDRFKSLSADQFRAHMVAAMLPVALLHPQLKDNVTSGFRRGDYADAVFSAFRIIEIEVRSAAGEPAASIGVPLMRRAFAVASPSGPAGKLTDTTLAPAEQQGLSDLFAGAFGYIRNAVGHRSVVLEPAEAIELLLFASYLLRIVDRRRAAII